MQRSRLLPASASPDLTKAGRILKGLTTELALTQAERDRLVASYLSLSHRLESRIQAAAGPVVVGISGAQGSGKTTFRRAAELLLREHFGRRATGFSIDDLYLGVDARRELADHVHPLFMTRGVPGTHDIERGLDLIRRLRLPSGQIPLPAFDKGIDDHRPEHERPRVDTPVDIILFDGWCVGLPPQGDVSTPINELESIEDPDGFWRRAVEQALSGPYAELFAEIDELIFLQVPSWNAVHRWRRLQEDTLRRRRPDAPALMDDVALNRFLMHYERLTRHALRVLPSRANVVCRLDEGHRIVEIDVGSTAA